MQREYFISSYELNKSIMSHLFSTLTCGRSNLAFEVSHAELPGEKHAEQVNGVSVLVKSRVCLSQE